MPSLGIAGGARKAWGRGGRSRPPHQLLLRGRRMQLLGFACSKLDTRETAPLVLYAQYIYIFSPFVSWARCFMGGVNPLPQQPLGTGNLVIKRAFQHLQVRGMFRKTAGVQARKFGDCMEWAPPHAGDGVSSTTCLSCPCPAPAAPLAGTTAAINSHSSLHRLVPRSAPPRHFGVTLDTFLNFIWCDWI